MVSTGKGESFREIPGYLTFRELDSKHSAAGRGWASVYKLCLQGRWLVLCGPGQKRESLYRVCTAGQVRVTGGKKRVLEECHRRKRGGGGQQESYLLCLIEQKGCLEKGVTQGLSGEGGGGVTGRADVGRGGSLGVESSLCGDQGRDRSVAGSGGCHKVVGYRKRLGR